MSYFWIATLLASGIYVLNISGVSAWAPHSYKSPRRWRTNPIATSSFGDAKQVASVSLFAADSTVLSESDLTEEEWGIIKGLYEKASSVDSTSTPSLKDVILEALPTMHSSLIVKIRQGQNDSRKEMRELSVALNSILDSRLTDARDLLAELLGAGEIRKLDALIGKAARSQRLDVAFFQVLNMNLADAAKEEQSQAQSSSIDPSPEKNDEDGASTDGSSNRYQILQHIYTRCQEEVEKTIPPGLALLNKLMRTEVDSIRVNQLNHYLCRQPSIIKTPDGKELELQGGGQILVPHNEFVQAIGNAVQQIRTLERAGGTTPAVAAGMVESCRKIAKEARMIILDHFGQESEELKNFEEGLEPVFRPSSPDSPYIKGV